MNYQKNTGKLPLPINPLLPQMNQAPTTLDLFSVDEGFLKGTIFRGLYQGYKNYEPRRTPPVDEREKMLFDVDKYNFGMVEMRMYLDNFPNDQEAIDKFAEFQKGYITAKRNYEDRYDALTEEASNLNTAPWNWVTGRWPGQGGES